MKNNGEVFNFGKSSTTKVLLLHQTYFSVYHTERHNIAKYDMNKLQNSYKATTLFFKLLKSGRANIPGSENTLVLVDVLVLIQKYYDR